MVRNIIFLLGILVFLSAIWAIKDEKIGKKTKIVVTTVLLAGLLFAYIYETHINENESKISRLLLEFKQGKSLKCGGYDITNEKFNYEFGTACFVAKREAKEFSGVVVPINSCE
ncbi:MAG: hypothetical protein LUC34_04875 [Campylobacter sp.]|nr:hypothetical protein [Campylobacter sp.]